MANPTYDLGDLIEFVHDFIDELVSDEECGVTPHDVMYIMLLTLSDRVIEYGATPADDDVADAIDRAREALAALPVERRWRHVGEGQYG